MRSLLLIAFIATYSLVFTQEKFEKETRIEANEVPEAALKFMQPHENMAKFKWYKEESNQGISYEAKAKINGQWYSVEFNKDGTLEDIEVRIKFKSIKESNQTAILKHLKDSYKKHKIVKVQIQFSGSLPSIQPVIDNEAKDYTVRYEIVLHASNDQGSRLYEMTFSHQGEHIKTVQIVSKNMDNIEY